MAGYAVGVRWSGGSLDKIQMQWSGVEWQERIWCQPAGVAAAEEFSCKTVMLKVCTGTA